MSKLIILVFSLFGLFSVCLGQLVQEGQCDPNIELDNSFNINEFTTKWYEHYRTDNPNLQGECAHFEFKNGENGIEAHYSAVNNNFLEESIGTITQEGNTPKLQLSLPLFEKPINFWVLQYMPPPGIAAHAVTFSCEDISLSERRIHIWVLTSVPEPLSPSLIFFVNTALRNTFGIELDALRSIDHGENVCRYLPIIEPGHPIILPGQCDSSLDVVQNFQIHRFLGTWHQIESYETSNAKGSCVRAEYSWGDERINILNSQVVDQEIVSINGYASVSSTDNSAKLIVELNIPGGATASQELWILRSDYENYAVAYTCVNDATNNQRRVHSWILARRRQITPEVQTAIEDAIRPYFDLNSMYYQKTDQSDLGCFSYPEPTDEPVVFIGQCQSIEVQAMQSFEAEKYMDGWWHIIKMYPSRFQDGTCGNAFYEFINGNGAAVYSQVKNEILETNKAIVVPAADGSGKLTVTLDGSDTTADYWILDTDYDNYAFAYTCQNLNHDQMQVGSWKLSRWKELKLDSEQAIDSIISGVPYLDERYYKTVDQTEDGCFYFPEPEKNVPVVFPGQCDENVAVVDNFDFDAFRGLWFEVESYPIADRTGQCFNHEFSFIDNTRLDLVSYSVTNQFRAELNGVVTRSNPTENNGKLTITITDANGEVKSIPFWILAVSYGDFAFAYSCEKLNDHFRAIRSWKLSRTTDLSPAAVTAISNAMANNVVLRDDYFEKIDLSNNACFYLPDLKPGEPVILLGQCDETIKGMPNFNIEKYAKRWRLIESYGSDFQRGTCNIARYTLQGDALEFTNSEVVDGYLESISGTVTVTSSDGTGLLTFRVPNSDVTFDMYILDTNYESYSLGYGCVNLPNNQMRVYSWKMSLENTLDSEAVKKMNEIIDGIAVLNNRFYYHINHTDTGCFYFPAVDPSSIVKFRGQCDQNIPVVTNFQLEKYLGRWYDIESYPEEFQYGTCNTATYTEHSQPGIDVDVYNTQVIDKALFSIRGTAVQEPSVDGSAKFKVTFNVEGTDVTADYWVLATNYETFALVYSCRPLDDEYVQVTSWKLSNTRELILEDKQKIEVAMREIRVLDERYFIERDHSPEGCFYFPEHQPGEPVVFPGQCDENIAAHQGFEMDKFEGTWHEIETYPKADQDGQCISQQFTYESSTNSMRLDSFSVLDLTQSTTESHVVFDSDDLSGKLKINTEVNGEVISRPYWILDTDYSNYALAYSCVNRGTDYRAVWSWKLSKTRQLSDSHRAAIEEAMAKVDVLRNDYFEIVQQTDAACFHLPDITPGDDVVLPGRCDPNIKGVPDFDIQQYAGEWRLIESYGSQYQSGTCNIAEYTKQGDTLHVTNTQVVDERLVSVTGTATVTSSDGSGLLTIVINNREYQMYILKTNYHSYALAYGCEPVDNDRRRVTSWKLSRFNTLTPDAISEINDVINEIDVLHQPYYYIVDRSPYSCFYFPEPDDNTPVMFRGQCDEDIPVVTDFKLEEYMGLWHDIESYPVAFQDGDCPNAFYSPHGINTVSVFNTHVVDQSLRVINGIASAVSTDGSAKLQVTFDGQDPSVPSNYWVLDTDYRSYALVYSCANVNEDYMTVASWKLSREKVLDPVDQVKINEVMKDIRVLDQRYFIERDQSPEGCFYFPEHQPGEPVVFPGQCDENIAAYQGFEMARFEGTWHEIEAYPKADQDGQCISQQFTYETSTNSMRLDSFSVLDLTQSTTESRVVFDSDDLSGKLKINTEVNGEVISRPYWILDTDYSNYALAYSCVNRGTDYRAVWSWKLSKTRQLSDSHRAAIEEAMAKVDVLRNDYFEIVQQTDAACFHLPDITPGDDVVLPGRCDPNIKGVPDFDIQQYAREWRLIESYGSRYQSGTCNIAEYTKQGDILYVTNTQVVNERLVSVTGTATVTSSDGSGLLTFVINNREYQMYILKTDYHSYALAYGCEPVDNDRRRVTSWKLSRFNTLTPDAIDEINDVINEIDVLHQPYYYIVDRSPYSCFYFPEPDDNTPVMFRGQCDEDIPVVTDFKLEEYMGLWHDIESYPVAFQDGDCPNAFYSPHGINTVSVFNTHVVDQSLRVINGIASAVSTDGSAKLQVTFDGQDPSVPSNYWVLDTDYRSYALVYSCANVNEDYMSVASWKLSREKVLDPVDQVKINEVMKNIRVLDERYFIERDHRPEGCFYFPEHQPGEPVVFPGQCDENIAAYQGFEMDRFEGTWHEIEAYPKADQDGQCISQQFTYETSTNSMRLDSFSVLDLTQSTTESRVVFDSDDLSGKLKINTEVNGEVISRPYWILDTDYSNYALAYSCVNRGTDYRAVWSWKLSKTRQLSDSHRAAIEEAMAKVDVLRNDYFEIVQQTDAACFHLPDITPGDDVVLPGRCDPNIKGVPDFDIQQYAGEWRLIESYGSQYQSGTCNIAEYTKQGDTLHVTNTQVVDERLVSVTGTATVTSSDGSGLLTFVINNREYQMYILKTNYYSYALAYGCEPVDNDRRRVTSWKLSRFNTLTPDAIEKINDVINEIDVLHQPYYYIVDRSPYSCFYFPEPDDNTPVMLRGQCDEDIPVVTDFKLEEYMGLWHDIESYPVAFQDGDCPNAFYSPHGINTVSVFNTHVVDQSLRVINGIASAVSTDGSAKLQVTFDGQDPSVPSNYWVLDTDYRSYALVYSCANVNEDYMTVASWKLSREKALDPVYQVKINEVMKDIRVLDQRYFIERDQSPEGCFYFPEHQPGEPVVFSGQCDENIAAYQGFEMDRFEGTWHEIEAYPKADQDGQCISQQFTYETSTNSMRLDSFSVLDLTQSTTESRVVFDSDDLSGKLKINTEVNGEVISRPYWILDTDYSNYALAYSCVNRGTDYRAVWSWKLSKTRQLSDSHRAAIEEAMAKVDVLRNDYFEIVQQTDVACFFYPELGPEDPVVLPGQCDPNISVVQNFNASEFSGRWRIIESYYSEFQEGTCNAATFSLAGDDSLIVVKSEVVDEKLNSITGSAINDGSGKLIVTFPNSAPAEYYVLGTDYADYSLIYTCENLPNRQRRVWSWKMSRHSSFTDSATNAINEIINRVDVLHAQYYQSIDRTDIGCFYYPIPDETSKVIFPGQCDETVPVVTDFKADLYKDTWYDVESYPSDLHTGTCNTVEYTANSDGTLTVENTQVVNQLQQTVTGYASPTSTDGSAKFKVTFADAAGNDVTRNYWVLATDYKTYSLVYSCHNIDDEFREVYSWKLSKKEPIIPQDAVPVINRVIEDVQVLGEEYFVKRSHTEDDCFYYPDQIGTEIIMNGPCISDDEVQIAPNFDANEFAGVWYEVSRYPSSYQNGECTATSYATNNGNIFDVVHTSVINEEKWSTTTQAVATDGSGIISINNNDVPFDKVFVLATDNRNYALLYSCKNRDDGKKQLFSWKLSKNSAGLSEEANEIIDGIVSKNIDLHEPYYRVTRQDYEACFYYPVFDEVPLNVELPGPCNASITGVSNLNVQGFQGSWYEVSRYPNEAQTGQCNHAEFTLGDTSGTFTVVNTEVINDALTTVSGEAVVNDEGQIEVTYNVGEETRKAKYYVLGVDYSSYALLYSCETLENGDRRRVRSWKLSRTIELTQQAKDDMNEVISMTQGLLDDYYDDTSHVDASCFYYPVFEQLPPSIKLPGPCNTTITGVPNFQIDRYLGTWYEIARYPQPAQTGQCTLTEYEPGATTGTYSVMISQILNEVLSKIRGEASVTSIDGTGKLEVRFSVNGVVSYFNYYVLVTDYTGFALVYMCDDTDDGRSRYVRSWKLSRNTQLSETAVAIIDAFVDITQGLNNDYYQTTSHSHSDCFYYPTQTGDRVILPGQCDTTIQAVESFNVARFANNSWYQIERYDAVGSSTCIGTKLTYDADTGDVDVLSFKVDNEEIVTTEGTGRLSSEDGSGKFSLVMENGSEETETTIYILATDYDGFAVAYSCKNINSVQRQVGAWLLSRGRTMSESSNAVIAEIIEQRHELHEPYFKSISHEGKCPEPSSAFLLRSSIFVIFVCALLQIVW